MKILLQQGHVIDTINNINGVYDILIQDGIIQEIAESISVKDAEVINVSGKYILPGLIDVHCHLREPGFEYKETIETGSKSAALGGFTSIACMPNTNPVIDHVALVQYILNTARETAVVNVYPIACITKGQQGEELTEIGELKQAGAIAISDDGRPVKNASMMKKALQYAAMFQMPVISHCEDLDLVEEGVMNEGFTSMKLGLKGSPKAAEEVMLAREILLAESLNVPVHIAHVTSKTGVALVRDAKKRGVQVTAETCPHYFTLTDEACDQFNTLAKVNPPLREEEDVEAIIEGLKDGTLDILATDHAPHHPDEKNIEFSKAAFGLVGFETALPLALTYLVHAGHLTLQQLVDRCCVQPAKLLGLDKGHLGVGKTADVIVVDIHEERVIDVNGLSSKSKNSPFHGWHIKGSVYHTIVNGKIIVRDKVLVS